jgi:hypothetical protein
MIHKEICTYEVAKLAKEKGFPQDPDKNDYCLMYCWDGLRNIHPLAMWIVWEMEEYDHDNLYAAPTQSLLQRWLREEKNIHISVEYEWVENFDGWTFWAYIKQVKDERVIDDAIKSGFNTYELALEDALKHALDYDRNNI